MNEREREQEREGERRERTCKSKIITLSPSSSPSPRGDPPTARLFVFFFSRGRRKRFYAPGEKFKNLAKPYKSSRVCGFARVHIYVHIHTRGRDKERKRERENTRESQRDYYREKRGFYYMLFITIILYIPHFLPETKP